MSTYTPFSKRSHQDDEHDEPQLSFVSLNLDHDLESGEEEAKNDEHDNEHEHEHEHDSFDADDEETEDEKKRTLPVYEGNNDLHIVNSKESAEHQIEQDVHHDAQQQQDAGEEDDDDAANEENNSATHEDSGDDVDTKRNTVGENQLKTLPVPAIAAPADVPTVEVRLKQISQEIEKMAAASNENQRHNIPAAGVLHHDNNNNDVDRQSFLSLTDLIRTLRPNNKQIIPQIDSDYSNAMRVLGETSEVVNNEDAHKF